MRRGVLALLMACHGGGSGPDAPTPIDAAADATIDAADPFVRVHYHVADLSGYEVLFYDPDNQLVARTMPDATGIAAAMLPTGGTVIAIRDPIANSIDEVRAIFGVEPGDDIDVSPTTFVTTTDSMTITVAAEAGTSVYRLGSRCGFGGSATTSVQLLLFPDCTGPTAVLAHATDAANVPFAAQRGTVTAVNQGTGSLSGPWLPIDTFTLHVTAADQPIGVAAQLSPILEGAAVNLETDGGVQLAAGGAGTLSIPTAPNGLVDGRSLRFSFGNPAYPFTGQVYTRALAPDDTAQAFDAATEELPWYDGNDMNGFDPATRTIALTRSPGGVALDGQLVRLEFRAGDVEPPRAWNIEVPPDATAVTLPVLPADFAQLDPAYPPITVRLVGPTGIRASSYTGYRDFRRGVPVSTAIGSFYNIVTISISAL